MLTSLERKLLKTFFRLGISDHLPESIIYSLCAPSPSQAPKHGFSWYHPRTNAWERYCKAQACGFRGLSAVYESGPFHLHSLINRRAALRASLAAYDNLARTPEGQAVIDALLGDLITAEVPHGD